MSIVINGKFYDLRDYIFEIETSGNIKEVEDASESPEAAKFFDELCKYKEAGREEREIVLAYYAHEGVFNLDTALANLAGKDTDRIEFAQAYFSPDESLHGLNPLLRSCIDWEKVWSEHLSEDFFEQGHFIFFDR